MAWRLIQKDRESERERAAAKAEADLRERIVALREPLRTFINACEGSLVLTTNPHYQEWGPAFDSLRTIRTAAVACSELYTPAPEERVPTKIKTIVNHLRADIEYLYNFRGSYTKFSNGKRTRSEPEKWRDVGEVEHAHLRVQNDFQSQKYELKAFLSGLDSF